MSNSNRKQIISRPSYMDIQMGCYSIAIEILRSDCMHIDYIVGLSRGGLIPAVELSNILNIPLKPISYSSKSGKGNNKNHDNALPHIYGEFSSGTGELPDFPTLLIVDDICDTGYTLREVEKFYRKEGHTVYVAALYHKTSAILTPHFVWQEIGADSPWIIFPWEKG